MELKKRRGVLRSSSQGDMRRPSSELCERQRFMGSRGRGSYEGTEGHEGIYILWRHERLSCKTRGLIRGLQRTRWATKEAPDDKKEFGPQGSDQGLAKRTT